MNTGLQERLVLCNLDTAVRDNKGDLLSCDRWAIKLFEKMGGQLAFISGKPVHEILHQLKGSMPAESVIACNGAVIYDGAQGEEVKSACVHEQEARVAIQDILLRFPSVGIEIVARGGGLYVVRSNLYVHENLKSCKVRYLLKSLDEIPRGWLQVILRGSEEQIRKIQEHTRRKYYGARNCICPQDANTCVILAQNARPERAFEELCMLKGVLPRNCVLLTDDQRDLPLAQKAGQTICSFDAPPEIQQTAGRHTLSALYGGGVGEYLYGMLKEYPEKV